MLPSGYTPVATMQRYGTASVYTVTVAHCNGSSAADAHYIVTQHNTLTGGPTKVLATFTQADSTHPAAFVQAMQFATAKAISCVCGRAATPYGTNCACFSL